ncbi:MAG TPA: hypothetical protein P5290_07860, partial [Candidatus Methanomethylicus sp.]|nr:hypothetical protein [Candidatus Methanomethylicus sp.]
GRDMGPVIDNLVALSRWLPSRGLDCLQATAPAGLREDEFRTFSLKVADAAAASLGLGMTVSGMVPADLDALGSISRGAETSLLFPLIAMDSACMYKWASLIGLDLNRSARYGSRLNDRHIDASAVSASLKGIRRFTVSRGRVSLKA